MKDLRPPPEEGDIEELRDWCRDLYESFKFPHFDTIRLVPRSATPDVAEEGVKYFDSDDGKEKTYDGSGWINNHDPSILGDTNGRVLRKSAVLIKDGTNAATAKITLSNHWNGDAITETDNVAKGATTGNFTLDATGSQLKVETAGLSGYCTTVLAAGVYANASTVALDVFYATSGNDIQLIFYGSADGAVKDITTLVDTGNVFVIVTYITDE